MTTEGKIFLVKVDADDYTDEVIVKTRRHIELAKEELELLKNWLEDSIENMELAGCGENKEEIDYYKKSKTLLKKLESI